MVARRRHPTTVPDARRERSSATVLMLVVVVVAVASAVIVARFGAHVASVERASATADVAALAAVTGGDSASEEVARANGADLGSIQRRGAVVVVRVERDGHAALAAAQPAPR